MIVTMSFITVENCRPVPRWTLVEPPPLHRALIKIFLHFDFHSWRRFGLVCRAWAEAIEYHRDMVRGQIEPGEAKALAIGRYAMPSIEFLSRPFLIPRSLEHIATISQYLGDQYLSLWPATNYICSCKSADIAGMLQLAITARGISDKSEKRLDSFIDIPLLVAILGPLYLNPVAFANTLDVIVRYGVVDLHSDKSFVEQLAEYYDPKFYHRDGFCSNRISGEDALIMCGRFDKNNAKFTRDHAEEIINRVANNHIRDSILVLAGMVSPGIFADKTVQREASQHFLERTW